MILDSLETYPQFAQVIDSITKSTLDNLFTCPTTADSYIVKVNNDSVIKVLELIACPIDSLDALEAKNDFVKYRLGGNKVENHGQIENGEDKSW